MEPAAQTIGDDAVDDVQAEAGAALVAAGREERIERLAPDIEAHAAAIVGKYHFDVVPSRRLHLDVDDAFFAVGKCVRDRVEEKVGQHLSVRAGIAVHQEIRLALDLERKLLLLAATGPQTLGDLL